MKIVYTGQKAKGLLKKTKEDILNEIHDLLLNTWEIVVSDHSGETCVLTTDDENNFLICYDSGETYVADFTLNGLEELLFKVNLFEAEFKPVELELRVTL